LSWDPQHYTRNLIDKTTLYELIAICWEVGQGSSVHNHRDQNCWMAAPIGKLLVENFQVGFQDIEAGKCQLQASNTVELTAANPCAVDPKRPVHRVVNPREAHQRAVSLHVYSQPFDTCVVYSPEQGTCGDIRLHYNTVFGNQYTVPSSQPSESRENWVLAAGYCISRRNREELPRSIRWSGRALRGLVGADSSSSTAIPGPSSADSNPGPCP